jgi:hypothetical protein
MFPTVAAVHDVAMEKRPQVDDKPNLRAVGVVLTLGGIVLAQVARDKDSWVLLTLGTLVAVIGLICWASSPVLSRDVTQASEDRSQSPSGAVSADIGRQPDSCPDAA